MKPRSGKQNVDFRVLEAFLHFGKFVFGPLFRYLKTRFSPRYPQTGDGPITRRCMYSREVQFIYGISIHLVTWCTNGFMDGWVKIAERTHSDV